MRRHVFNAWCAICLLVAAVLLAGYVLDMDVAVMHGSVTRAEVRAVELLPGRGRLRCFFVNASKGVTPARAGFRFGGRVHLSKPRFDVARFDSHWISRPGSPSGSLYLVACPLWFAIIVALVSPAVWFIGRRRRRRRERRDAPGFGVVPANGPLAGESR